MRRRDVRIDKAYLVSCVNARLADLREAAQVVRGRRVADHVEFYVAAASADIQAHTMTLRMLPVGTLFEPYRRTVRDMKRELGKEVELVISGATTNPDRRLLQAGNPARLHPGPTCTDHGIEPFDWSKWRRPR